MADKDVPRDIENEITLLFRHLLKREPNAPELKQYAEAAREQDLGFLDLFELWIGSDAYKSGETVTPGHPPGHFYSPVVNPTELHEYFKPDRQMAIDDLAGLDLTADDMHATFGQLKPFIGWRQFTETPAPGERFYCDNGGFPVGDAIILSAMIQLKRPRRIIEIGSGHSTACMLDTIEHAGLDTMITCVEPNANRLRSRLKAEDRERVTIHEVKVQTTDPDMYAQLDHGDILFIDSTHVLKTGSDVCFELFDILPRLKPGVVVHFHDILYPFEYNDEWIFDKRWSWNEVYALRAFLMYNEHFRVTFFNQYFGTRFHKDLKSAYGAPVAHPGAGLWLERRK